MTKEIKIIIVSIFLFTNYLFCQTYKTITIIPQTTKTLHSGGNMLGGVSRIALLVDIPPNTIEWYYSFSTSSGEAGSSMLNLAIQVGAYATTGPLGVLAKNLKVPPGTGEVDVWLMTPEYKEAFEAKNNERYYPDLSEISTTQSIKPITNPQFLQGSYYLGLRNPSAYEAVSISIEVVAIVKQDTPEEEKGRLYGSMGWKAYERGELDKCIELSNKALSFNPNLCWVKFNVALVHMVQENDQCLDEYIDAISTCKKDPNPKNALTGALEDLNTLKQNKGTLKNMEDIEALIKSELSKY